MPGDDGTVQQEARGFSVKETIVGRIVSPSIDDNCEIYLNMNKNHLLHQCKVNNLNIKKRKT